MGEPKLHNFTITVKDKNQYYIYKKKIGLREVSSEYHAEKDKNGALIKDRKVYKINGKKILIKGAGWNPDLFLRQNPEIYYKHINYVRDMELNTIRLEGNSEGDEFYDYCDELGILIITGWCCCDSWQRWDDWTKNEVKIGNESVISQIRKLSRHPSVIIFILGSDKAPSNGIEPQWREIFAKEKWPNEILSSAHVEKNEDQITGVKMTGPYSWVAPHYFYVEELKTNINGGAWGFMTEGGPGENPLRKGSIEKVYNKKNMYNYTSESWNYHCGRPQTEFANLSFFLTPLEARYGKIKDFEDFERKSCATVYESHKAMFEAYSSNKYNSTGVIQWMLNNAFPSNIWHLYDYYFVPSPAYFSTKKSGERIHPIYNYADYCIYLVNNYYEDFNSNFTLNVSVFTLKDKILYNKTYKIQSLKADAVKNVDKLKIDYDDVYFIHFDYSFDYNKENYFYTNTYWVKKKMDEMDYSKRTFYNIKVTKYADFTSMQDLAETDVSAKVLEKNNGDGENKKNRYKFRILNEGDAFALLLEMKLFSVDKETDEKELITPIFWNDNYFSLKKGQSFDVIAEYDSRKSDDLLLEIIGWNCYYELNFKADN